MSRDLNSVVLVGRLVRDPEVRYTPSGTPVARISIANGERIKQNNEWTDFTNFFGKFFVMKGNYHKLCFCKLLDDFYNDVGELIIELLRRLVKQHNACATYKGAYKRDSLLHSTGQFIRIAFCFFE